MTLKLRDMPAWKSIKNIVPPIGKRVEVTYKPTGIGGHAEGWTATGIYRGKGDWSLRWTENIDMSKQPTHWREIFSEAWDTDQQ